MPTDAAVPRGIAREKKTVEAMVRLYCVEHHQATTTGETTGPEGLCGSCRTLLDYSHQRLDRCPYGDDKPSCKACPIHCYRPAERESMRQVMRDTGPKMLWRHPWLAVVHLWKDHFRRAPKRRGRRSVDRATDM